MSIQEDLHSRYVLDQCGDITFMQTRVEVLEKAVDRITTLKEENVKLKSKINSLANLGRRGYESCDQLLIHVHDMYILQEVSWNYMTNSQSRW